jgi:hypothetical protein
MLQVPVQTYTPNQPPLQEMEDIAIGQETAMTATALNGDHKPRKMRASCDACSRAKVRYVVHKPVVTVNK